MHSKVLIQAILQQNTEITAISHELVSTNNWEV